MLHVSEIMIVRSEWLNLNFPEVLAALLKSLSTQVLCL